MPTARHNEVDPAEILQSLGLERPDRLEAIASGTDTLIWRVEHEGAEFALRVFRREQRGVEAVEVKAMELALAAGLPVPRVEGMTTWQDRPVLLLSWCPGRTLDRLARSSTSGLAVLRECGRAQARLHRVSVPRDILGPPHAWIARAGNDECALTEKLRGLALQEDALIHLDYHPLNVLAEGDTITGILDWANVQAGDPRADEARTFTLLRVDPDSPNVDGAEMEKLRRLAADLWWHGYTEVAGVPDDMPLFYAWAGAYMIHDLSKKVGQPGMWIGDRDLDGVRRWTAHWKRRSGLSG